MDMTVPSVPGRQKYPPLPPGTRLGVAPSLCALRVFSMVREKAFQTCT